MQEMSNRTRIALALSQALGPIPGVTWVDLEGRTQRPGQAAALGVKIHSQIEASLDHGKAPDPDEPIPYRPLNRHQRRALAASARRKRS